MQYNFITPIAIPSATIYQAISRGIDQLPNGTKVEGNLAEARHLAASEDPGPNCFAAIRIGRGYLLDDLRLTWALRYMSDHYPELVYNLARGRQDADAQRHFTTIAIGPDALGKVDG